MTCGVRVGTVSAWRASSAVVTSSDVVAADVARIARGLWRSRGASAVRVYSVREGAGDPVEGRGRDACDVVDERVESSAGASATDVIRAVAASV